MGVVDRCCVKKTHSGVLNKEGVIVGRWQEFQMGILVSDKNWHSSYIRSLLNAANDMGARALRITPSDLQPGALRALPDVVYNRIPTRKEESDPLVRAAKGRLAQKGVPLFNARFFNKREVDRLLRRHQDTSLYLPASWYEWNGIELEERLNEFGSLYLKPISGSLGEGIFRLEKKGQHYLLETRVAGRVEACAYANRRDLLAALRRKHGYHSWIMQEEIPLCTYRGRKTDFRVHVQRRPEGSFVVTGFAAKVGAKGAVTTHVRSGGRIEDAGEVLAAWFADQSRSKYDAVIEAALAISYRLSQSLDPRLGELGLDMGYSDDGRLVLFEANAKPGRSIFHSAFLRQANQASLRLLIEYAQSLTKKQGQVVAYEGVGT